ncbi:MAG: hypothetical protein IJR28_02115, partial [Ottowia sp.]|nr:hypothetical protein [Ottowia sp.]
MMEYQNITQYPCRTPIHHRLHKPVMHAYQCTTNETHPARAREKLACAVTHCYAPAHAPPLGGSSHIFSRGFHEEGFIYSTPPRSYCEGVSRFLKIIPIAALLAAGGTQAWAADLDCTDGAATGCTSAGKATVKGTDSYENVYGFRYPSGTDDAFRGEVTMSGGQVTG